MTTTITEKLESRSVQSSGGRGTGKRSFYWQGYDDPSAVFATFGRTVSGLEIPDKGKPYPSLPGLIAKDFSITPVSGQNDCYVLDWSYEMMSVEWLAAPEVAIEETLPNQVSYVELSSEIRTEFFLAWRYEPQVGDDPPDPDVDIGGSPCDHGLQPTSIMRRRQELVLTETVNEVDYGRISGFAFHRNSTPFLGAEPGRVLYRGASVRRTGLQVYTIAHSFVDCQFKHQEQQPLVDQHGVPVDWDNDGFADFVYWIQPFRNKKDLNQISAHIGNSSTGQG